MNCRCCCRCRCRCHSWPTFKAKSCRNKLLKCCWKWSNWINSSSSSSRSYNKSIKCWPVNVPGRRGRGMQLLHNRFDDWLARVRAKFESLDLPITWHPHKPHNRPTRHTFNAHTHTHTTYTLRLSMQICRTYPIRVQQKLQLLQPLQPHIAIASATATLGQVLRVERLLTKQERIQQAGGASDWELTEVERSF